MKWKPTQLKEEQATRTEYEAMTEEHRHRPKREEQHRPHQTGTMQCILDQEEGNTEEVGTVARC